MQVLFEPVDGWLTSGALAGLYDGYAKRFDEHLTTRLRYRTPSLLCALLRRLFAQLCGHDVWPSLQHISPMLAKKAPFFERYLTPDDRSIGMILAGNDGVRPMTAGPSPLLV